MWKKIFKEFWEKIFRIVSNLLNMSEYVGVDPLTVIKNEIITVNEKKIIW